MTLKGVFKSLSVKAYPIKPQTTTRMAFLAVPINHNILLITFCFLDFNASSAGPIFNMAINYKFKKIYIKICYLFGTNLILITLMMSRIIIQAAPITQSHIWESEIFLDILDHISKNVLPLVSIPGINYITHDFNKFCTHFYLYLPKTSLTCDVTIIRATAEVNPDATGPDTKSIRKPGEKKYFSKFTSFWSMCFLYQFLSYYLILGRPWRFRRLLTESRAGWRIRLPNLLWIGMLIKKLLLWGPLGHLCSSQGLCR